MEFRPSTLSGLSELRQNPKVGLEASGARGLAHKTVPPAGRVWVCSSLEPGPRRQPAGSVGSGSGAPPRQTEGLQGGFRRLWGSLLDRYAGSAGKPEAGSHRL